MVLLTNTPNEAVKAAFKQAKLYRDKYENQLAK